MTYQEFWQQLTSVYDPREAQAVARTVLEVGFGLSLADIAGGATEQLGPTACARLARMLQRLLSGEPVQYVLGVADFGPRQFRVAPGVLIPRPETYELCQWVCADAAAAPARPAGAGPTTLLDIGTGSGCIACTLALEMPLAKVAAYDLSQRALRCAAINTELLGCSVSITMQDALRLPAHRHRWDAVVSNPPYICESEAADMAPWVVDYEPREALFVPDDDALLFYRSIAAYAQSALKPGGRLYFEINPRFAKAVEALLQGLGFAAVTAKADQQGKTRFIRATWQPTR